MTLLKVVLCQENDPFSQPRDWIEVSKCWTLAFWHLGQTCSVSILSVSLREWSSRRFSSEYPGIIAGCWLLMTALMVGAGNLLYMINIEWFQDKLENNWQNCDLCCSRKVQWTVLFVFLYSYGQLTQIHPEVDEYKLAYAQVCWIAKHLTLVVFSFPD